MVAAGGIRAGQAFVELFVDDSRLIRGLRAAQKRLAAFGQSIRDLGLRFAALGSALLAPLALATRSFVETGSALVDRSARTGASVEALSALGFAADQTGASIEAVEAGLRVMQKTVVAAGAGSTTAANALARLGLTAATLQGLTPDQQFRLMAEALRRISDPTQRAAAAMKVFGKSGTSLLPMIAELETLRAEALRLGLVMSTTQAQAADTLGDAFSRAQATVGSLANAIGTALAPTLTHLVDRATGVLSGFRDWVARNQGLVVSILTVGTALVGIGAVLIGLGLTVSTIGAALGGLATVASGITAVLGILGTAIAALATPFGIAITATVTWEAVLLADTQAGGEALTWLGERFTALRDDAIAAWQGISDALAAGDIGLAARVLWLGLKLEWQKGIGFLDDLWTTAVFGWAELFTNGWFNIQVSWAKTLSDIAVAWAEFANGFLSIWNNLEGAIASGLASLQGVFDTSIDVPAVQAAIQQEITTRNETLTTDTTQTKATAETRVASIEQDRQTTLTSLMEERQTALADTGSQVEAAKLAFSAALTEARTARKKSDERVSGPSETPPTNDLSGLLDRLGTIPEILTAQAAKLDVTGTFSATAISNLGVGSTAADRTAVATEATASTTAKLLREMQDSGLEFE